jgi:ribosome-associated heat shock protein Hsp15
VRLDKWLWAARFFKTRALAAEAVEGGKVHLGGQRSKPGKPVRIGSRVLINKGGLEWDLEIVDLPAQRRPASEACQAYRELSGSQERREQLLEQRRITRLAAPQPAPSRPNKRDRRLIHRFKAGPG